jgi:hypothetical protein
MDQSRVLDQCFERGELRDGGRKMLQGELVAREAEAFQSFQKTKTERKHFKIIVIEPKGRQGRETPEL